MCGNGGGGSNKPEMTEAEKESAAVAVEQYDIARDLDFVKEGTQKFQNNKGFKIVQIFKNVQRFKNDENFEKAMAHFDECKS